VAIPRSDDMRAALPGAGFVIVCAWMCLLIAISAVQLWFLFQAREMVQPDIAAMAWIFRIYLLVGALKLFVLALALYFLLVHRTRASICGAVAAMLFFTPVAALAARVLGELIASGRFPLHGLPPPAPIEFALSLAAILYLLLSERVNSAFGLRTRALFMAGVPHLWSRLRGREPLDNPPV
jgi:hypothetical protein